MRRFLPTVDEVRNYRFVRWLGPRVHEPHLWRLRRRSVARGVAIGVFFGFLIPIAQIPAAAAIAFLLRANLWATAASTLVTNPLTFGPVYYAAYRLGAWLLGAPDAGGEEVVGAVVSSGAEGFAAWWERFASVGKPLFLGLSVAAVAGSVLAYFGTLLVWRIAVTLKRRRGIKARAAGV